MRLSWIAAVGGLVASLLVVQVGVAVAGGDAAACRDDCEGEDAGDDCPPFCGDCADCAGCFRPIGIFATAVLVPAAAERAHLSLTAQRAPSTAEPGDILVVPRAS